MMLDSTHFLFINKTLLVSLVVIFAFIAGAHASIYKRNSRAAYSWLSIIVLSPLLAATMYSLMGWFGILVISPLINALAYWVFGVNRLSRKVKKSSFRHLKTPFSEAVTAEDADAKDVNIKWQSIINTGQALGYSPLKNCNIHILNTGDEAYPAMLDAIHRANKSITLFSYIFTDDETGNLFIQAVINAHQRGIEVRFLVDAVGSAKSKTAVLKRLQKHGIAAGKFNPVLLSTRFSNLRNHRKLLIIDGITAFTGGLNIAQAYWPKKCEPGSEVLDLHFQLHGDIVNYLQEVFINDWLCSSGELLKGGVWFNDDEASFAEQIAEQNSIARVIVDGPSFEEERMRWHFLNAINCAEKNIKIISPYFLPDDSLISALCSAALRGIDVDIITPKKSDHRIMDWALKGSVEQLLARGCHLWHSPQPFDHSKLLIIDDDYVSLGSSNWDDRSLRLNYELNIECYDKVLASKLIKLFLEKKSKAISFSQKDLHRRSWPIQLRDGIARMFNPYL